MAHYNAIIAVDFDGTVVTHAYPEIGEEIGAEEVLRELVQNGYKLILYTLRHGKELQQAIDWFRKRKIPLWGINNNPEQKRWSHSPKVYADLYIDDSAIGCPLQFIEGWERPAGGWTKVREELVRIGYLD